ncbi:unnamed protein product [Bursaphelenchus xylophilus]|uniref:(pine wood nematode) hypothetical protein n=1 Tax=Bursaphelenchus xylophilus TaxID=6326 RepID=A0A1I7RS83_BURXY|nr:unnamed protein product [Bursaphelenchus xylophilus]CAG9123128.1 unnamed protein product [Bursaphelenchus xylophilus]
MDGNCSTPRGGPVPKRGRPFNADENMEETYIDSTYRGGLTCGGNDSLAEFMQTVEEASEKIVDKVEELQVDSPRCADMNQSVLTAKENVQTPTGCNVNDDDTLECLLEIQKSTPTPLRKPHILNKTPASIRFDLEREDDQTPLAKNTMSPSLGRPDMSMLDLTTAKESTLPLLEDDSKSHQEKLERPEGSSTRTGAIDSFVLVEDDPVVVETSLEKIEEVVEDVHQRTLEAANEKYNKTFEVERSRCFEVTDCVREACLNLSKDERFREMMKTTVDSIEFDVMEYFSGSVEDNDRLKNDFDQFLSLICNVVRSEEKERLNSLHEKDKEGYDYMLEVERKKYIQKERQWKESMEEAEKAIEELKNRLTEITKGKDGHIDGLNKQIEECHRRIEELENQNNTLEKQMKSQKKSDSIQPHLKLLKKCDYLERRNHDVTDRLSSFDDLQKKSEDLNYELNLVKLHAGLISKADAIKFFGPSVDQCLNDYLKSQSKV